jgi:hypothetical protein
MFKQSQCERLQLLSKGEEFVLSGKDKYGKECYRGKYHCTIEPLFDWFGLVCFANKNKKLSVVIQLIPNQSNRRSTVQ